MQLERWTVVLCDLWRDPDGGWHENGSFVQRHSVTVQDSDSDAKLVRRLKRAAGIQGWKTGHWADTPLCWRQGTLGAYAYQEANSKKVKQRERTMI